MNDKNQNDKKQKTLNEPLPIKINLQNNTPVLHEFACPEDKVLNPTLEQYIEKQIEHLKRKNVIKIEVAAKEEIVPDFKAALNNTFGKKIDSIKKGIIKKRVLAFAMLLIGVFFLGIGFLLNGQKFFYEIFLVASWVFLWRAVELFFFEIQLAVLSAYKYIKILKADINVISKD